MQQEICSRQASPRLKQCLWIDLRRIGEGKEPLIASGSFLIAPGPFCRCSCFKLLRRLGGLCRAQSRSPEEHEDDKTHVCAAVHFPCTCTFTVLLAEPGLHARGMG